LDAFTLDLNASQLILTFDEVVDTDSLNISDITLQADPLIVSDDTSYSLQSSQILSDDGNVVILSLGVDDINGLVLRSELATSKEDTFINFPFGSIVDYYGNNFTGRDEALQVTKYIPDTSPPTLKSFTVNMNTSVLSITFSESVNVSTLDVSLIKLQNSDGSETYTLTADSNTSSTNGDVIDINISKGDFNAIAANTGLFTSLTDSYIILSANAISDASENSIKETSRLNASDYIADEIYPELESFTLDVNTGVLTLTFSETVDFTELDPTGISIVNNGSMFGEEVILSMATPMTDYATSIELDLADYDINAIKANTDLATEEDNTYLSILSSAMLYLTH